MRFNRKYSLVVVLIFLVFLIKVFSLFPGLVERWYSRGVYPAIAGLERTLFGWIPFSIGDLLYAWAGIYLIRSVFRQIRRVRKKLVTRADLLDTGRRILTIALVVYCWFNLSWGLNYNRQGIGTQLGLPKDTITANDIRRLTAELADSLNSLAAPAHPKLPDLAKKRVLFGGAIAAYGQLSEKDMRFDYLRPSVKPSLYSYLGNYVGFTGYYNPFTGEAQVNTTVPNFLRPFTTCHEIGHQLGYAKEYEANLSGFLSASESPDPAFRYSIYFDMYAYARPYLYAIDSLELKRLDSSLHPLAISDFKELRQFLLAHQNPVERVIDIVYSQYLRMNEQPSGRLSYNEVVVLLVGYFKKYRWTELNSSSQGTPHSGN